MTIINTIFPYYDSRKHNRQVISDLLLPVLVCFLLVIGTLETVTAQEEGTEEIGTTVAAGDRPVWERAVEALQYRRNEEAIPLLRLTTQQDPEHRIEAIRLLAHALEQTGKVEESERVLRDGVADDTIKPTEKSRIAFDLAALLQRNQRIEEALESYTVALSEDGAFAPAYLNRANLRVERGAYGEALSDYELYLALRPQSQQRPAIEQMMALLNESIEAERIRQEEEERRLAAEEEARRIAEEEQRKREEEEQRLAAERRQQMLNSVLESLGSAEDETESFELEGEEIREYEEEIDILE